MRQLWLAIALGFTFNAQAAIVNVDFDEVSQISASTITVPEGFTISARNIFTTGTNINNGFCTVAYPPPVADPYYCSLGSNSTFVDIVRTDGTLFSPISLDLYLNETDCGPQCEITSTATISAWDSNNNLLANTTLNVLELGSGWHTQSFDSGWTDIYRLTVSPQKEVCCEIGEFTYLDNITAQVVPVPAAAWLFASGLGLLGWMRRRA